MAIDLIEQILPHIRNSIYPLRLSLPDWKMKEGDILDASSIEFYDKSWTYIRIPFQWRKYDKIFWFRHIINIPPDFAGKPLVLLLDFSEALLYINGKPYYGIDQHHKEILICEKSKLNEQFVIAIQAYSDRKHEHYKFDFAELAVLDTTARRLNSSLIALQEIDKLMEHGSLESREIRELIHRTLVFLKYFRPGSEEYPNAIRRAYNFLLNTLDTDLKTNLPGLVHLIGQSHINTVWPGTLQETVRKCGRTFSSVLRLMEEFPEFKFSQSQPVLYEFTKTHYPDLYKQIKQRIAEGKWEPLGSMWTEADCNIPNGESLIRQILFGKRFFKKEFGIDSNTLWLPCSYGFNWALPQILKKSGITNFYTSKLSSNDTTKFPYTSFWWQGIDKTKILAHVYPNEFEGQITPNTIFKNISSTGQQPILHPFGNDNCGNSPTKESLEFSKILKTIIGLPPSQLSTVKEFFTQLEKHSATLPTWNNELYLETRRWAYTTNAKIKKENRECETLLYTSELLASIAMLFGKNISVQPYPQQALEQAWKKLLLNQSYNIISGTSITDVYKDSQQDYQNIKNICASTIDNSINGVSLPAKKSKSEFHFAIFNSLGWQRNEYIELYVKSNEKLFSVEDSDGNPIPCQMLEHTKFEQKLLCYVENIPALGFKNIVVRTRNIPAEFYDLWETTSHGIETPYYRVRFDKKGTFSSIYAKYLRRELFQKGKNGNQFITFRDNPKLWEAWNIDAEFEKHRIEIWKIKQIKIIENGPLRAVIRFEFKTDNGSILSQDVRFYRQSPRIDFQTHIRWQEKLVLMKVAFPFNIKTLSATYGIQFGAVNRSSKPHTDLEKVKYEVPAQQWADISDPNYGISLLNDCKYGYDAKENTLRLTLLRSPHYPNPAEPSRSDRELIDQGEHTFCYALHPHSGNWIKGDTVQRARELNNPIIVFPNIQAAGIPSIVTSSKSNIVVDSIKKAEESDNIIVRMHEAHGVLTNTMLHFGSNTVYVIECDLLENKLKQCKILKSKLPLIFRPFEIKTIKIVLKVPKKK